MLEVPVTAPYSEMYRTSSNQRQPIGTGMVTQDGRWFRYGRLGGSAITLPARLFQSEVPHANWDELAVAAAAVGAKTVTVTLGAQLVAADDFNGGYLLVEDDTGEGFEYLIEDTPAIAASAAGAISLVNGLIVALVAATTVSLLKHPLDDMIIHPSPPTAAVAGVNKVAMAANAFGWFQVRGLCAVLTEGTLVIGDSVQASSTTDGAVTPFTLTEGTPNAEITPVVGHCVSVGATTEHSPILLNLPL